VHNLKEHCMKAYIFYGDQYLRYDVENDRVDPGYPLPIKGNWPGFAEAGFDAGIDAAVNWGNGKAYFFREGQYVRYDIAADRVDPGYPLPIGGNWPGFTEVTWASGVDDGVNWGTGKAYFFFRDRYLRYDIAADRVDPGYPLLIKGNWSGFAEAGFDAGIDSAVNWGNGKAYFFRAGQYLRYDLATDRVDPGYPLQIRGNWPGFTETGFPGVHAAVLWN
jgi:hypothetical protein